MSEQKLVSPLLDGFVMGDPISSHDGVRCCPAMRENSDEKYIVKIISVPSSQRQLDALLLTGAYPDAASATEYFKEQADGIVKEAELLQQLSKLEGFLPYTAWQVVPMDNNRLGYDVYLISPYKRSLEKFLSSHNMTHLGAVNLGLDLCAALSMCRRAGFIFVDLKPSNIFINGQREYRIGDLGFANARTLKFNSLPEKYCSKYTPPELHDPLSTLNPTADIYAVGMILYQIYNNGELPFEDKAPAQALPSPLNADYEMAEIIQKACDPNPRKRWQTPIEMGQALVSYMQRNTVNDVPIVPPAATEAMAVGAEPVGADEEDTKQTHEELGFLKEMVSDETAPDTDSASGLRETEVSDDVTSMLAEADDLISHELPEGVVEPEYVEPKLPTPEPEPVSEPEPVIPEDDDDEDDIDFSSLISGHAADVKEPEEGLDFGEDIRNDAAELFASRHTRKKKRGWVGLIVFLLILALLGGGALYYYNTYYLMSIDNLEINGSEDTITVSVTTDVDETLLSVVCTDTYGNTTSAPVSGGQAVFTGLNPDTMYKFTVEVEGFHGLTGSDSGSYTTSEQTNIVDFTAMTGTEDGSVILNFTVDGPEKQDWIVEYTAEGEEPQSVSFTGHMVTISNLTVGKTYTFKLVSAVSDLWIVGSDTLEFTASQIVVAEKLSIVSCVDGVLTAQWSTPDNIAVDSWTVRCYAESGYDETITTGTTSATFSGISAEKAYTVEVLAYGMTQSARAYVTANPTTVTNVTVTTGENDDSTLNVSWEYQGNAPEGGWLLMYTMDGSDAYEVIQCAEASAVISNRVPGTVYNLSIQAADGSTVFGGKADYTSAEAPAFNSKDVDSAEVQASLCNTPSKEGWTYKDISDADYSATFTADGKASLVIYTPEKPDSSKNDTKVMIVIRDEAGNVIPHLVKVKVVSWNTLWNNRTRYCSLDIPAIPNIPGKYTVSIYFDGAHLVTKNLTISE